LFLKIKEGAESIFAIQTMGKTPFIGLPRFDRHFFSFDFDVPVVGVLIKNSVDIIIL
jgi:hypothetical protein